YLTTQLLHAEEDGSKLSNEELYANIILLFGAGHETTVNLIGNGLLALFRNPDQLALLKARPDLITNAIEEFLRYDSSVQMTGRTTLEDVELGGRLIPKGEAVLCLLGSANHDPSVYPDHPERLDIVRPNVRPLSFGGGIHFCLGAQLARIEAEVAISPLLRRLPELRLDDAVDPEWRPTFVLRGLKRLPASWERSRGTSDLASAPAGLPHMTLSRWCARCRCIVMAGIVPAIHVFLTGNQDVD